MDEGVGTQKNNREEETTRPESREMPEPEPWVRHELERIAEEARQMAGGQVEQVQESAADVGVEEVEMAEGQTRAAGDEASTPVENARAVAEEMGDEVATTAGEEMSDLVSEARGAGAGLERAARAGVVSATRPVQTVAVEARESADDVVRATRQRIAVAEEMSMAPEYRGISFGDGFRFGCGFTVAGCLFWLILSILLAAIPLALSAVNVIGLPGR